MFEAVLLFSTLHKNLLTRQSGSKILTVDVHISQQNALPVHLLSMENMINIHAYFNDWYPTYNDSVA